MATKTKLIFIFFLVLSGSPVLANETQKALNAINRGDYKTAIDIWQNLANRGNNAAQFNLGLMYFKGDGVKQNLSKAAKWFRLAATQGNAEAQLNLGDIFRDDTSVRVKHRLLGKHWPPKLTDRLLIGRLDLDPCQETGVKLTLEIRRRC